MRLAATLRVSLLCISLLAVILAVGLAVLLGIGLLALILSLTRVALAVALRVPLHRRALVRVPLRRVALPVGLRCGIAGIARVRGRADFFAAVPAATP